MTDWLEPNDSLKVLCELEPATRPDLRHVRRQVALLDGVTDAYLVPDNHLGRATVSSIAVAGEVASLGGSSVACVNSRDRNLLGFRRDLLTAAAYGVDSFLFVRGDEPSEGTRVHGPDGARDTGGRQGVRRCAVPGRRYGAGRSTHPGMEAERRLPFGSDVL